MTASKLNAALKLAAKGFRVFPLAPNSKIPVVKDFPKIATTDKEQISKWFSNGDFNIGISTDDLLVVDVDVKNKEKNGIETMAKLNRLGKIFPPTTQQLTATEGAHLIYSTPFPVSNSASKLGPGLDVRGKGGYVVGAGSTIGSKAYTMDSKSMNTAPTWLLEACQQANEEKPQAHLKIEGVDEAKARLRGAKYLTDLPPVGGGNRNVEGYKVAAKLKDYGLGREDTFIMMMNEWKCEPPLELEELKAVVTSAYKYGKEAQGSAAPETMFASPAEPEIEGRHPFEFVNDEYAFVTLGSSHRIIHETTNEEGHFALDYLGEDTFHAKLASKKLQTADGNSKPLTKAWMASTIRRSYDAIVFAPGLKVSEKFYNLWRGFSVKPLEKDEEPTPAMIEAVRKFEEHLFVNIADSNIDDYNWIYGWFAHIIQKPWEKPGVALVMKGRKGVGKNILLDCVGNLFKPNYMVTAKKRHLIGNFNSHMENLLLLVLDEAFWSGSKDDAGILKALITENNVTIERKGVDSYDVVSRLRTAIVGNEKWLVPATEDERRYAVFNVGESRMQDTVFFTALREGMEAGGYRYLLTKLQAFDLSTINIRAAPITVGLHEQKQNSLSPLAKWWLDSLMNGYIEGVASIADGEWMTHIDRKNLTDAFIAHTKNRRQSVWLGSDENILDELHRFVDVKIVKRPGELVHLDFPSLDECRASWDTFMKAKTKWRT